MIGPDPSRLPGAKKSTIPDLIQLQLTTLVNEVPEGDDWLHEIKFDGYRSLCRINHGQVNFFTREGKDWTDRFGALAEAAAELPVSQALLDGEVVVVEKDGSTNFQTLQGALSTKETHLLSYCVFDVPYLNGYDLTQVPLLVRKETLAGMLETVRRNGRVRFSDHVIGQGKAFYQKACQHALEGVISKRKDSRYRPGRGRDWLKIKCHQSQEFVIGGFTEPSGSRAGFGALLLGVHNDKGDLLYAGRVGTGFTEQSLRDLRSRLDRIEQSSSPFADPLAGKPPRGTHWVKPELAAEIEFTQWTRDGLLRHPSFKGLREDKPARKITRERTLPIPRSVGASSSNDQVKVAGVLLTHPDRILYPEQGITKLELALFYEKIAGWILPHLAGRPLVLVRCPRGYEKECFYQKHTNENLPDSIRRIDIRERHSVRTYAMIDSLPGLISLVQIGVLEIHTWGSRSDKLEYPDRLTFDLDPDPSVPWEQLVDGAHELRERLSHLGLPAFVKTTGGKGLHIVVPIAGKHTWEEIKEFSKMVAGSMAQEAPDRYICTMSKNKRTRKTFIDYLRNTRGATVVAAYSTRARRGAPVSVPLDWEELGSGLRSDHFNVQNLPERLTTLQKDPWEDYETTRTPLSAGMKRKLGGA